MRITGINRIYRVIPFLIILLLTFIGNAQQPLTLAHITGDAGLPDHRVKHIFQDSKGFIWIATLGGFGRYSGYEFKTYKHQPDDLNSLSDYAANHIFEDANHHFWIATRNGLNLFDPATESFHHFFHTDGDTGTLSSDKIVMTTADAFGNIWVATRFGINRYNPEDGSFKRFLTDDRSRDGVMSSYITDMLTDREGRFWVGTERGLFLFDYDHNRFVRFLPDSSVSTRFGRNRISDIFQTASGQFLIATFKGVLELTYRQNTATFDDFFQKHNANPDYAAMPINRIAEDQNGNLWFGTFSRGLLKYDPRHSTIDHFVTPEDGDPEGNFNHVQSLLVDANNNLWIGTFENGVFKHSALDRQIMIVEPIISRQEAARPEIYKLLIDRQRRLWVGTNNAGLRLFALKSDAYKRFTVEDITQTLPDGLPIESQNVSDILQDSNGNFWIATMGYGLYRYNPKTAEVRQFTYHPDEVNGLKDNFITTLYEDSRHMIWIGTAMKGVYIFDPATNTFENFSAHPKYFNHPQYLASALVSEIAEDTTGNLWIGTGDGLSIFNRSTRQFTHLRHAHADVKSLSSDYVMTVHIDRRHRIWVGTFDGGLNLFQPADSSFTKYTENNILPDNTVLSILEDADNNLFIKTRSGITRFSPTTGEFTHFDHHRKRIKLSFSPFAAAIDTFTKAILWGGDNKIFVMTPELLENREKNDSPVVLTGFKIFNREAAVPNGNGASRRITYAEQIVLPHDQNVITFEFALLNYDNPSKHKYAYRLVGFDKDWIYAGYRREVTYTNLDPGDYTFNVKAADSKGRWSEQILSVKLTITPPFWKTPWAYALYAMLFLVALILSRRYELNRIKLKNDLRYKEFESRKLLEVDRIKSNFFTNLSHEFRTPLTVILASLEQLETKIAHSGDLQEIDIIKNNAHRLLRLVNELLELAKIDSGKVKLQASPQDLGTLLHNVVISFASLADRKHITLTLNGSPPASAITPTDITAYIDRVKMERVFYNLLANAVKFTPAHHHLHIRIEKGTDAVTITFENTGVEIPEAHRQKIFDRFYQVGTAANGPFEGTGIGLALVKEYVELHGGKVDVFSDNNRTIFTVRLPLGASHLNEHDISDGIESSLPTDIMLPQTVDSEETATEAHDLSDEDQPVVLIIEDNAELRRLMCDILGEYYRVLAAEDGAKGLALAETHIPDLVVSDIMMPEMDGYELAKRLRANEKTDHIPVILLTARAATEDKLEGLSIGVDDYLVKPFHREELLLRIRNLIHSRRQMREKFLAQSLVTPGSITVPSSQKQFIEKLKSVIDQHLTDDMFSVDVLCKEIGMSRTQLHRKIKSVTNLSTTEFIRTYRLQLAAELLKQDAGNIAEISQKVGFGSQAYFTKLFQEHYGVTPLEFRKQHRQS